MSKSSARDPDMASPRGRPSTAPASSDHERALRHIHTWKRHCANLRSMHESGSRGSSTQSLQLACGVCGVYGLESLYSLHNGSVKEQDVQSGAGELMGFVKWGLVEGDANKPSKIDPALETAGTMALLEFASSIFHRANSVEKALIDSGALEVDERWGRVRGLYYSVRVCAAALVCPMREAHQFLDFLRLRCRLGNSLGWSHGWK